jgi:uncharacterized protein YbjT (DUF2867 family)
MNNKILVLGGTGKTGRRVVERLTAMNLPVVIGSRSTQPAFDWENSATWAEVLQDINKVYITFQPDLAIPSAVETITKFVKAAKESGVQHLVLLSGRGEKEAQLCENIVINSGLDWTIIRASWFMQNFSEGFFLDSILANEMVLPKTNSKEPFINVDDIADVVVSALVNNIHSKKIYELTGPELLTFESAVSKIAGVKKQNILYQEVSIDEYVAMLRSYELPEDSIWLIKYLFTEVLDGRNESVTNDIEKVLGRKAKDFGNYVVETLETGIWNNEN